MKYFLIFLVVAMLLGGGALLIKQRAVTSSENKPWIEIITSAVFELDKNGQALREFKTGDEVGVGYIIEGKNGALANIYFPDGTVVRIPGVAKFVVEEFSFNAKTEKITTRINLVAGRLWNKILELATPDSLWEVRTANAVATVRGTAFGVEFLNGKSKFIGSEHKVEVAPIDAKTKRVIKEATATIQRGNKLEIAAADIEEVRKNARALAMKVEEQARGAAAAVSAAAAAPAAAVAVAEDWIRRAEAADAKINQRVDELRRIGLEAKELRDEFRNSVRAVREEIKKEIETRVEALKDNAQELKDGAAVRRIELKANSEEILRRILLEKLNLKDGAKQLLETGEKIKEELKQNKDAPEIIQVLKKDTQNLIQNLRDNPQKSAELLKEAVSKVADIAAPIVRSVLEKKLFIEGNNTAERITEGDKIVFSARAANADGTSVDVTSAATWKVLGPIGSFVVPGVFVAKISDVSIAEFGEAAGMIVATYRDPATGNEYLAKSANITIVARLDEGVPVDIGGQ